MTYLKTLSLAALLTGIAVTETAAFSFTPDVAPALSVAQTDLTGDSWTEARRGRGGDDDHDDDRGRGRGRGGDDTRSGDDSRSRDDSRSSGRDRPRIPGGSGCDDPGDLLEHPECGMLIDLNGNGIDDRLETGASGSTDDNPADSGRRRPRVPGGSGCDDPGDILEHPECSA